MKRILSRIGVAVAALAVTVALTFGAYLVAGKSLSQPAEPVGAGKALAAEEGASPGASESPGPNRETQRAETVRERHRQQTNTGPTSSPSPSDHVGGDEGAGAGGDRDDGSGTGGDD